VPSNVAAAHCNTLQKVLQRTAAHCNSAFPPSPTHPMSLHTPTHIMNLSIFIFSCNLERVHKAKHTSCMSCCSALQCDAVCCSVLQESLACVHKAKHTCCMSCCSMLQCVAVCSSVLQCVAICCSVVQCVAVCCSVLQCVASAAVLGSAHMHSSCIRAIQNKTKAQSQVVGPQW